MQDSAQRKDDFDVIDLSARAAAGEAPVFTGDARLEKLLGITLSLATELAVTRERLDTVERLLERAGLVDQESVERFTPDDAEAAARNRLHEDYLARIFRVLR